MVSRRLRGAAVFGIFLLFSMAATEPCDDSKVCGPCTEIAYTDATKEVLSCTECSGLYKADSDKTMQTRLVSSSIKIGDELCSKNLIYGLAALGGILFIVLCITIACWWNGKDLRNKVMVFRQRRYVMRTENDVKPVQDESIATGGLQTGAMRVIRGYVVNPDASQLESQRTPDIHEESAHPSSLQPETGPQNRTSSPMQVKRPTLTLTLPRLKTDQADRLPSLVKPKPLVKSAQTQVELRPPEIAPIAKEDTDQQQQEANIEPSTEEATELSRPPLEDSKPLQIDP